MVSFDVEVDVSKVRARFRHFPPALRETLAKHVLSFVIGLRSYVVESKLQGNPLHQRSGNLIASVHESPVLVSDNEVSSSVGTNLSYGRVHELGGTFNIPAYQHPGRGGHPDYLVREHQATYPKRAFLVPSLQEKHAEFNEEMQAAVTEAIHEPT